MMTPIDMMIWFLVLLIMITIFLFMFCTKNDGIEDDRDTANSDVEEGIHCTTEKTVLQPLMHQQWRTTGGQIDLATSDESLDSVRSTKEGPAALAFWKSRSLSLMSMCSTKQDSAEERCGDINFGLDYDFSTQTLKLRMFQGKNLAARDKNGLSDPYVRIALLPDKKHRLDTKVKRRTLNPKWNETFYFEGFPVNKLNTRVLHFHVLDYDRFSRDDSIGEVFVPLCKVDFTSPSQYWRSLNRSVTEQLGEVLVSLAYSPSNNTLTVGIIKARNLKSKDLNGKSDPYVKVWLMFGEKKVEKKKSPVFKCNLNPVFNQTFEFNVPWEQIRDCSVELTVMDFDTIGRNEVIGKLRLSSRSSSGQAETRQWGDMIARTRQEHTAWHRLKSED